MASSGWQGDVTLQSGGFGYSYFKGNFRVDSIVHSGSTVTVSGAFGVHNDGGQTSYYQFPINAAANGYTSYQQVVPGNEWIADGQWVTTPVSFSFSAGGGETSKQVEILWSYNNGTASNSITYTLTFDPSLPPAPTMSFNSATKDTIRMNYTAQTNGLSVTAQYSMDGGAWKQIQTSSSDMSGIFVIISLLPNSSHTITIRSHTSGGDVTGTTLTVSTTDTPAKLYGSVSGTRKRIKELYCSVNDTRKRVKKVYGSVNGERKLIYEDPNL